MTRRLTSRPFAFKCALAAAIADPANPIAFGFLAEGVHPNSTNRLGLAAELHACPDPWILARIRALADSPEVPAGVQGTSFAAINLAQQLGPRWTDNEHSAYLRSILPRVESVDLRRQLIHSVRDFPSRENYRFLADILGVETDPSLHKEVLMGLNSAFFWENEEILDWANDLLLELAESTSSYRDRAKLLENATYTKRIADRGFQIIRREILHPPAEVQAQRRGESEAVSSLLSILGGMIRTPERRSEIRQLLEEARPIYGADARIQGQIERLLARIEEPWPH